MDESRDIDARCNRIKDNRVGLEFYRNTSPTADPEVRFKENQWASSGDKTIFVDEGMEKLALGTTGSPSDRGLNRIVVDDGEKYYVSQYDSTYTSEVLNAQRNQWYDGSAETSTGAVRAQSEPVGSANVNRIEADSLITTSYTITCLPAAPDTMAPDLEGGAQEGRTLARLDEEAVPEDDAGALSTAQSTSVPDISRLAEVWPNPARGETRIRFAAGRSQKGGDIRLSVFDVSGRRVVDLSKGPLEPGWHEVSWSGRDSRGKKAAPGVYFLRFESGSVNETRKIHLR